MMEKKEEQRGHQFLFSVSKAKINYTSFVQSKDRPHVISYFFLYLSSHKIYILNIKKIHSSGVVLSSVHVINSALHAESKELYYIIVDYFY